MLLIGLSVAATLLSDFSKNREIVDWLILSKTGMNLSELWQGQLWRLWTPMFLHANPLHLIFNMYWLYVFGSAIEMRMGTKVLAGLVLATELGGTVGQLCLDQPVFVGFSGAGFGLFGYVWMKSRYDPGAGLFIDSRTVGLMMFWLVLCIFGTSLVGPVANGGHVGGLVVGMALGYPLRRLLQ